MLMGKHEENGLVESNESCSDIEGLHVQTLDTIDQVNHDEIDRSMFGVIAGRVIEDESHRTVAAEWMTPCNELF
jgi:hypothetical protein